METEYYSDSKVNAFKIAYHTCIHTILAGILMLVYLHYIDFMHLPTRSSKEKHMHVEKEDLTVGQIMAQ